ncbi:MAG: threonylcarbamoyl-AMP synthase [Chloroflexi bacterium]|nr:threonylcarbamoyl-AMP synthase [Chloroflexota bacterium]MBU1750790.1 threonylcarbamoyl-AMP synthase [Chloroflexota bacterium]
MTARLLADTETGWQEAARLLRAGGVVAFPTDTVYGLGAHAFQPAAVARLYTIKDRPWDRAIPLLLAEPDDVRLVTDDVPAIARRLMTAFWPGALTIVLPRNSRVPDVVTAGGDTVALRVPDHARVRRLIALVGAPLAATSANPSGCTEPVTTAEVQAGLGSRIAAIVASRDPCPGGAPSTVVGLAHGEPVILREGPVSRADLAAVL